jgi:hypothetical protein
MNLKLKMRFVILDPFLPSIPIRSVVAISPLFHFRRKGKYQLLEKRRKFPTSKNAHHASGNKRCCASSDFEPLYQPIDILNINTIKMLSEYTILQTFFGTVNFRYLSNNPNKKIKKNLFQGELIPFYYGQCQYFWA